MSCSPISEGEEGRSEPLVKTWVLLSSRQTGIRSENTPSTTRHAMAPRCRKRPESSRLPFLDRVKAFHNHVINTGIAPAPGPADRPEAFRIPGFLQTLNHCLPANVAQGVGMFDAIVASEGDVRRVADHSQAN
jgi:hypothetical protein